MRRVGRKGVTEANGSVAVADDDAVAAIDLGELTEPAVPEVQTGGRRLGEILVDAALVNPANLVRVLQSQPGTGKRTGRLLVDQGHLGEADLVRVLAEQLALQVVDLGRVSPSPEAVALVPETLARQHHIAPLRLDDGVLEVATTEPSQALSDELAKALGRPIRLLLAPSYEVQRALDGAYRAVGAIDAHVKAFQSVTATRRPDGTALQEVTAADAPVVQVVNLIITQSLRDRASDVHIEPQDGRVRVRFRIDGALHDITNLPEGMGPALVSRLKIMAGMNIVERRRPQDGQIAMQADGRAIDIRVSTVATIWGEKCVLRILDKSRPLYKLGELGMPADTHAVYGKMIAAPLGMVICAGPTGSGKTTTLYASLTEINATNVNITTVEDPVEYVFPDINQIQINEAAGLSFVDGLKSILRQDPDVILVGEIRDPETARIAVQSSLTGHLVLSSVHATDTAAALHRLLDMGIESFLVASAVTGVVAQRLLRRICASCKVPYQPSADELAFWAESEAPTKKKFYAGEGCNFCAGTGFRDRIGIYEFMPITPSLRRLIVGWATQEEIRRAATAEGMRSLKDEAIGLVVSDTTTISEVIRGVYAGG